MTREEAARLVEAHDPRQPGWPWLGHLAGYYGQWDDSHVFAVPLTLAPPGVLDNTVMVVVRPDGTVITGSTVSLFHTLPGYREWVASLAAARWAT